MEKQFVIFKINNEEYGVDIINIQEICRYQKITAMPQSTKDIKGIINYRGSVISVIDIRERFKLGGETIKTPATRIIILLLNDKRVGLLVDEASQTLKIDDTNIENVPNAIEADAGVRSIGKVGDRLISLIDVNNLMAE